MNTIGNYMTSFLDRLTVDTQGYEFTAEEFASLGVSRIEHELWMYTVEYKCVDVGNKIDVLIEVYVP